MIEFKAHWPRFIIPKRRTKPPVSFLEAHQNFLQMQSTAYQQFLSLHRQYLALLDQTEPTEDAKSSMNFGAPDALFSREDLEYLAHGLISKKFGPRFEPQDRYTKQVRMPRPPLLLADRVISIDAEPHGMLSGKTGAIVTETDVTKNAWYLHQGHMPTGIMIESGQADLLLISWLGADQLNQGNRVYRLLGCEMICYRGLPKIGETLRYTIHVDGYAKQGNVRLFFFHYECTIGSELLFQVRNGQAGFFTEQELNESNGVIWDPAEANYASDYSKPACPTITQFTSFSRKQLEAFAQGNTYACFGVGFERCKTHTRTPHIQSGDLLFFNEITHLEPFGGPAGRGYIRAVQTISPNDWFFDGHFHRDPCMPGTLMFEAELQLMTFYMTALGFTIDKDGWRFELVKNHWGKLICRGQVTPTSKEVVYEIYIDQIIVGDKPTLYAYVLGTVDGLKSFQTHVGLQLIPDYPLSSLSERALVKSDPAALTFNGHTYDYNSLLACAWGKPSQAFGTLFEGIPEHFKVNRLPGPPYHFVSRIISVDKPHNQKQAGIMLTAEYDVPTAAWYFLETQGHVMPFSVLMEAMLQPCGWLSVYSGYPLSGNEEMFFRNLDGHCNVHHSVTPQTTHLRSQITLKQASVMKDVIIVQFHVKTYAKAVLIAEMDTSFGFFSKVALAEQKGITELHHQQQLLQQAKSNFNRSLSTYQQSRLVATDRLNLLSEITGYWPKGGQHQLGAMRAVKVIRYEDWYFKSHFYQDPVQPGSLGVEGLLQLLQCFMLEKQFHQRFTKPAFEPVRGTTIHWKFRGQVLPENTNACFVLEVVKIDIHDQETVAIASGSLWLDTMCIYQVDQLSMKLHESKISTISRGIQQNSSSIPQIIDTETL